MHFFLVYYLCRFRYKADIEKKSQQNPKGNIQISWLLHIFSFHILVDDKVDTFFKIFGCPFSFRGKMQSGKKKVKKQSQHSSSTKKTEPKNTTREKEKFIEEKNNINSDKIKEETADILHENFDEEKRQMQTDKTNKNDIADIDIMEEVVNSPPEDSDKSDDFTQSEKNKDDTMLSPFHKNHSFSKKEKSKKKNKKRNFFYKIQQKIIGFWKRLKGFYQKGIYFLHNLRKIWSECIKKKEILIEVWQNEENRKGVRFLWTMTKKVLHHIAPKKWNGYMHIGMKNPADTGKVLGLIGAFGGIIGILPEIQPDFEKKVFEGKVQLKGRIYSFYLIRILILVWKNKEVRRFVNNIKKVWEELSYGRE